MGGKNIRVRGGQYGRTRVVLTVGNPDGNRKERRVAAKIARMNPEKAAKLPLAAESSRGRWTDRGRGLNGS